MNNRYLYRAKRTDNGEFIEGLLTIMWGQFHIINPDDENTAYPIYESTICQCTGLKDKNGKLIWESDVIQREIFDDKTIGIVTWMDIGLTGFQLKVENKEGGVAFYPMSRGMSDDDTGERCNDEVIGNIFDEGSENIGK